MVTAAQLEEDPASSVVQGKVIKTTPEGTGARCVFADGTAIVVSKLLASFIHPGDELLFPLNPSTTGAATQIRVRTARGRESKPDTLQADIGYAAEPSNDKRGNLFVSAEAAGVFPGIREIHLPCAALRDYFYVGNRTRVWDRQPSFYELLGVDGNATPAELRVAFKLRTLELWAAHAPAGDLRAIERAFNILACPQLRACYEGLLRDPAAPALFPYRGFGSLLVAGDCFRDGTAFYARRILAFLPEQNTRHVQVPLRKCVFYDDRAIYRDTFGKREITLDPSALPLSWDSAWNQWKHRLGAKVEVRAAFLHSGKRQRHGDAWHLVRWEVALPSRTEVTPPADLGGQIDEAGQTHHRFG